MSYSEFKKFAIKARWYYAEMRDYDRDYGKEISDLLTLLCYGDRDMSYSLLVLWTSKPNSFVYYWSVRELYYALLFLEMVGEIGADKMTTGVKR